MIKEDNKKIDIESPKKKVVPEELSNEPETKKNKKSNKKKESGNKSKNKGSQKVKRKRIQTFNSSDEEIDSEEEGKH